MLTREQLLEINPQFAKFYEISPREENNLGQQAKSSGNCLSCAATLADVLLTDPKKPVKPVTTENASYTESEALEGSEKIKCKTPEILLEKIRESEPGSIFVLDIGDHVYNLFKNFDDKIMLLDADLQIFKYINKPEDLRVPVETILEEDARRTIPLRDPERKVFDLFHDGEEKRPDVYKMGVANAAWKNAPNEVKKTDVKKDEVKIAKQQQGWTAGSSTFFANNKVENEKDKTQQTTLKLGRRRVE